MKHLLIVEDDASVLRAFTRVLAGNCVSAALDPHEALHMANTIPTLYHSPLSTRIGSVCAARLAGSAVATPVITATNTVADKRTIGSDA